MNKTLLFLVSLFALLSVHFVAFASDEQKTYTDVDYSTPLEVGVPVTGTFSADEDVYEFSVCPSSPARGYTVALKAGINYTICTKVTTADGKPDRFCPVVFLLKGGDFEEYVEADVLSQNHVELTKSSELFVRTCFTPEADGNYRVLCANPFYYSGAHSFNYSISVYKTPIYTPDNAEYTSVNLGETQGTLSLASDAIYIDKNYNLYSAKFFKVNLKAGETYIFNYQLLKKTSGNYPIYPYIFVNDELAFGRSNISDSISASPMVYTPDVDGDCKIIIYNYLVVPNASEFDYKLTITQMDKTNGLESIDYSKEYTIGSVLSGTLNDNDKSVYFDDDFFGYAEGYNVTIPADGKEYRYCYEALPDMVYKNISTIFIRESPSDTTYGTIGGNSEPLYLIGSIPDGKYNLTLLDNSNPTDYKFRICEVITDHTNVDCSRKLVLGKPQSELIDAFSAQTVGFDGDYCLVSGYSMELEKDVTYMISCGSQKSLERVVLYDDEYNIVETQTNSKQVRILFTPEESGTYIMHAEFAVDVDNPLYKADFKVERVPSIDDLLSNATKVKIDSCIMFDELGSEDMQLFIADGMPMWGKAYQVPLANGDMLIEKINNTSVSDDIYPYLFLKGADGKFQPFHGGGTDAIMFAAESDTVLYYVLTSATNNVSASLSAYISKPLVSLFSSAVEIDASKTPYFVRGGARSPKYDASLFPYYFNDYQVYSYGTYKLKIAKGETFNFEFASENYGGSGMSGIAVYKKSRDGYILEKIELDICPFGPYPSDTVLYVAGIFTMEDELPAYYVNIESEKSMTLFELFDAAPEIGNMPFHAEGYCGNNNYTLTNIREFKQYYSGGNEDYFTCANAYKLTLKRNDSVSISYSTQSDAQMLIYSRNVNGSYDLIVNVDNRNWDESYYGYGESYLYKNTSNLSQTIYIYVAPYYSETEKDWTFDVVRKPEIKTPNTIADLFDAAPEIDPSSIPFYFEGDDSDNAVLYNAREAFRQLFGEDYDWFVYAQAYKLHMKAGQYVRIDYASDVASEMILASRNNDGSYSYKEYYNQPNSLSVYVKGTYCDFTAATDTTIYIYVAPREQSVKGKYVFRVVESVDQLKGCPYVLDALLNNATEISVPYYDQGNYGNSSTVTLYVDPEDRKYMANAYKLSLKEGESVRIDYATNSFDNGMIIAGKNPDGSYFVGNNDIDGQSSYYGNGLYCEYTAPADTTIYINAFIPKEYDVSSYNWAFNVIGSSDALNTPSGHVVALSELLDAAPDITSNIPFYAVGNSHSHSTPTNLREFNLEYYVDEDWFTFANAYKLSLKEGESVHIDYTSRCDALMLICGKQADGSYIYTSISNGNNSSFYGKGERCDFTASSDTTIYICVSSYSDWISTDWGFNVVKSSNDMQLPLSLTGLLNAAPEITKIPFSESGYSGTPTDIIELYSYLGEKDSYLNYANAYKLNLKEGEMLKFDYSSDTSSILCLVGIRPDGSLSVIDGAMVENIDSYGRHVSNFVYEAPADTCVYLFAAPFDCCSSAEWTIVCSETSIMTISDLFAAAPDITGNIPFTAAGNSVDNSTLTNIREYIAEYWYEDDNYITYANAYKLSLKEGESVHIDYSSVSDGMIIIAGEQADGSYIYNSIDNGTDNYTERYDFTASSDTTFYIYVAPYYQMEQTDWAFNVVKDQSDIKTPDVMTLSDLFAAAPDITGNIPFTAAGNSVDNSTLTNIKELDWYGNDWVVYANAYKLSLEGGESVHIDYTSKRDAIMIIAGEQADGSYIYTRIDNGNISSFYGNGECHDFTASSDTTIYICVSPFGSYVKANWAFNVVKSTDEIKLPAVSLPELFADAPDITSNIPFYAAGNSADNSTVTDIYDYKNYHLYNYANAYKLSLKGGESVHIDYSSECDALMLICGKQADGSYIYTRIENGNNSSFYGNGERYDFTASSDTTIYIYVSPYFQLEETDWAINIVKNPQPQLPRLLSLSELLDAAPSIDNVPFNAVGNSADNSTLINIREFYRDYWGYDDDWFVYANAYKLSLKGGETVHIGYSSVSDGMIIIAGKQSDGSYIYNSIDEGYDDYCEYHGFTAPVDTTIYICVLPYLDFEKSNWAFSVERDQQSIIGSSLSDLLDNATLVSVDPVSNSTVYSGLANKLYVDDIWDEEDSDGIPATMSAVAFKALSPANGAVIPYFIDDEPYMFMFRKTSNGYEEIQNPYDVAGDTIYYLFTNQCKVPFYYVNLFYTIEIVTEVKSHDLLYEQDPTFLDVMSASMDIKPFFVNHFGDTAFIDVRTIKLIGADVNMNAHEFTLYIDNNNGNNVLQEFNPRKIRYVFDYDKIIVRFGVPFTLAVSATGNGTVNSNVSGKYLKDTEVAISAVPAEHYHFVKWSNGSTKATDTILVVSDTALVAEFAIDTYNVELTAENGTVTGAGEYAYGSAAAIAATPAEGFHFVQWSNGSLKANDTIVVVSDTALVATFEAHSFGEWNTTLVATCTASGLRTHACACGETEVDTIPAHGHTIVVDQAVAATYTSTGLTEGSHCSVCDSIFVAQQVIPMLASKVTNVEVTTLPAKTSYKQGEELDVAGGVVTVSYSDESSQTFDIIAEMVSGFDSQKLGAQQLIVTVSGVSQTATFEVTVEKADAIDEELSAAVVIYAHHNTIVVENAEADIYVYDATGRCIARRDAEFHVSIALQREGIYIVRTGDKVQRVAVAQN